MRNTAKVILGATTIAVVMGSLLLAPQAYAAGGKLPDSNTCKAKPEDAVTKGGCVVLDRKKGNCAACHVMAGVEEAGRQAGNIAPPLVGMKQRFPDKGKLRAQIADATKLNPASVMPPFERHGILSKDEVDQVVEFVLSL